MKKFFLIGIACFVAILFFIWLGGFFPGMVYSDGNRSGVIYKFSKKGFIYKTWEGELSLGMGEKDDSGTIVPRVFEFSVFAPDDSEIIKKIKDAERLGERITLHYKEYAFRGSFFGDTPYDIIDVEK